ncbi:hypothetical protein GGER_46480 [Serratia rubidaea]
MANNQRMNSRSAPAVIRLKKWSDFSKAARSATGKSLLPPVNYYTGNGADGIDSAYFTIPDIR